jgi:hypothetical protein
MRVGGPAKVDRARNRGTVGKKIGAEGGTLVPACFIFTFQLLDFRVAGAQSTSVAIRYADRSLRCLRDWLHTLTFHSRLTQIERD